MLSRFGPENFVKDLGHGDCMALSILVEVVGNGNPLNLRFNLWHNEVPFQISQSPIQNLHQLYGHRLNLYQAWTLPTNGIY